MKPVALMSTGLALAMTLCMGWNALGVQAECCGPKVEQLITTQGAGEVKIAPDSLAVQVSVETDATTLSQARTVVNQKMAEIIKRLKALKVENLTLKTQSLAVYPQYSTPEKNRIARVIGYHANNTLQVSVKGIASPERLGELGGQLVDTALNAEATNVGDIQFFVDDISKARTEALRKAVLDARKNADAMAEAAGVKVTGVYTMEGYPQYSGGGPFYARKVMPMAAMDSVAASTPVEAGETTITSSVTLKFQFDNLSNGTR